MPEWLPYPSEPLEAEIAALILSFYADQVGELCAGSQLTLQQHHEDERIYPYTITDVRQNQVPKGTLSISPMSPW
jgi:hypothetical protein